MAETLPSRPVLLTGASGALGRILAQALADRGWDMRLTDLLPFPGPLPQRAIFNRADLGKTGAMQRLAEGCGTILHFGGASVDRPFAEMLAPNITGLYHVYEAARQESARMVFASSNHSIGFHERTTILDSDCSFRPDSFYGLSKAYGELMGRLYWDKHGVENVNIRIGSCFPEPADARMLATWLSAEDLVRLTVRATLAAVTGHAVVWGASANSAMTWWRGDQRGRIGWAPEDSADPFTAAKGGQVSTSPVTEHYQGGVYCLNGYSRPGFAPVDPLGD